MKPPRIRILIRKLITLLSHHTNSWWFSLFLGFLAFIDNLIVVIPTDGILISSTLLQTKKWFRYALYISVGSSLGAFLLAAIIETHGLPLVLELSPGINHTEYWKWAEKAFNNYGLWLVFVVALTPVMQNPSLILACLAKAPLDKLILVIFIGRSIKFLIMSYVASHAPKYLHKLWGLEDELKEVGLSKES